MINLRAVYKNNCIFQAGICKVFTSLSRYVSSQIHETANAKDRQDVTDILYNDDHIQLRGSLRKVVFLHIVECVL